MIRRGLREGFLKTIVYLITWMLVTRVMLCHYYVKKDAQLKVSSICMLQIRTKKVKKKKINGTW